MVIWVVKFLRKDAKLKIFFAKNQHTAWTVQFFIEFAVVNPLCINFGVVDHFIVTKRLDNTKFRKNWTVKTLAKENIVFCQQTYCRAGKKGNKIYDFF